MLDAMKLCKFSDCNRESNRKGLCYTHYERKNKNMPMDAAIREYRPKGAGLVRNDKGEKECIRCGEWKQPEEFSKSSASIGGLQATCKLCCYKYHVNYTYNLDWESYERMLAEQDNCCAICKKVFLATKPVVDHDHTCCSGTKSCGKCVRGLLCTNCNTRMGWLEANRNSIATYGA